MGDRKTEGSFLLRGMILECIIFPAFALCEDDQKYANWKKKKKKREKEIALMSRTALPAPLRAMFSLRL